MDPIERQLRDYYEAEASGRLRPEPGDRRRSICEHFAERLRAEGRSNVLDLGSGPATDHSSFVAAGIAYTGVDLAVGNGVVAAGIGQTVVPASLFDLPFRNHAFAAGWSMSTLQHVPDHRIDEALAEFVRVLEPRAPVTIGLWGGRDDVIESESSTTGIRHPRHYTLRSHERIRSILGRHLVVERDDVFAAGDAGWEYHVSTARTPGRQNR